MYKVDLGKAFTHRSSVRNTKTVMMAIMAMMAMMNQECELYKAPELPTVHLQQPYEVAWHCYYLKFIVGEPEASKD